jgi:hypothetical protein
VGFCFIASFEHLLGDGAALAALISLTACQDTLKSAGRGFSAAREALHK